MDLRVNFDSPETNPWLALLTVAGETHESMGSDEKQSLWKRNRRYWNGYVMRNFLSDDQKKVLLANGLILDSDVEPLSDTELNDIYESVADRLSEVDGQHPSTEGFAIKNPGHFRSILLSTNKRPLDCNNFIFPIKLKIPGHIQKTQFM